MRLIRGLVDVGTTGHDAAEARRIRTVNAAALFGVIVASGFDAFYIATFIATGDSTLTILILFVTGFVAIYGLIILLSRVLSTVWTASLIGASACANLTIGAMILGPEVGFQLYLVPIAGLTALMTRRAHWPVPIGIAVLSVGLFAYIELALDAGMISPYSDVVLDGIYASSIVGAIALALLSPLLYRQLVAQAEADLQAARDRAERLLFAILPAAIARQLEESQDTVENVIADRFESVTVLFADVVGFTAQTTAMQAENVVARLNSVFSDFDDRAQEHGLEKIKTIGDAYMLVGGAPERQTDHADRVVRMALDILADARALAGEVWPGLELRVGIHSGPAVAGVIGRTKFSYDLWGDTVNTASRLEGQCPPGSILLSDATKRLLTGGYALTGPHRVDIRGKGELTTWMLEADQA